MGNFIHWDMLATGRVQGVGYRAFVKNAANKTGIKGCVRNLSDGNVSIEAEGTKIQLDQFLAMCKDGPWWAEVRDVQIQEGHLQSYDSFDIRR